MEPTIAELLSNAGGRTFLEAPAGYGKTDTIAEALRLSRARQLILTHTHAGVDSLRKRLKSKQVPTDRFRLDTLDSFCVRIGLGYPTSSGAPVLDEQSTERLPYDQFHRAAQRLLSIQGIRHIIASTYGGAFVDEYQDCSITQHEFVMALAEILPVRILGDPLQKLLGFGENPVIDWEVHVLPHFARLPDLTVPLRWLDESADPRIAAWLSTARISLRAGQAPKFSDPIQVYEVDPITSLFNILRRFKCDSQDRIVVLNRFPTEMNATARLLGKLGYSSMDEIEGKDLLRGCELISEKEGVALALALIEFGACCCSAPKQSLTRVIGRLKMSNYCDLSALVPKTVTEFLEERAAGMKLKDAIPFLEKLVKLEGRSLYRRDLYYSMRQAIQLALDKPELSLAQAAYLVRQRVSRVGRRDERRIVSRPILVKGLQFEHVVVLNPHRFGPEELYVALSRATKSVHVVGPVLDKISQKEQRPKQIKSCAPRPVSLSLFEESDFYASIE